MTNPNRTLIAVVLDRSGSMQRIQNDVVGGFNTFIDEQKKGPGECNVTLAQFDSEYEVVFHNKPLAEVPKLEVGKNFIPRATTALHDAVGLTIAKIGQELAELPEHDRPGKVVVVIITDGFENASHEYTGPQIRDMIRKQESEFKWLFTYLAADLDKAHGQAAADLGVRSSMVMQSSRSAKGSRALYAASSASVLRHRLGDDASYTASERKAVEDAAKEDPGS